MGIFSKGYKNDAGLDICLDTTVCFSANSTTIIDLQIKYTPKRGTMAYLCERTSAAEKGLCVAKCPIDADYCGNLTAIVHNLSGVTCFYHKGQSFCQLVVVPIKYPKLKVKIRKAGKRRDGKLGSTGV